jgi:general secretion pathway protein E
MDRREFEISADAEKANKPPALPYSFAKRHGVLITTDKGIITLSHLPSTPLSALIESRRFLGQPVSYQEISEEQFAPLLQRAYSSEAGQARQTMEDIGNDLDLLDVARQLPEPEDLLESADEAPIIRLINALLAEAIKEDASDIHIEPFEDRLAVRFRIDGVMREVLQPQRSLTSLITSRIKVMAKLNIAEKRLPQDGRISLRIGSRAVDIRVSTLPSSHGERVVMRVLDKQAGRLDLEQIGIDAESLDLLKQLIARPHGIILVTGPTGSGKTTTLYGILSQLNDRSRNIITVEDPIEYYLDGIGQTQVNAKIGMDFAKGLRAILRQDPDVVMVGEIRDLETAEIAVQSSLTGHLVFSTLHTNTAVGAVTRLRDMGVEPFLLSSSVVAVLAQRLVRKLCTHCRSTYTAETENLEPLGLPKDTLRGKTIYQANGCPQCNHTGYRGRIGLFELVSVDEKLRQLIHDGAAEHELAAYAHQTVPNLAMRALDKIETGETSVQEALRVTREE